MDKGRSGSKFRPDGRPDLMIYAASQFFTEFRPNAPPSMGLHQPFLMHWHGLLSAELTAAAVSILGMLLTVLILPETKSKTLEELS